MRKILIDTTKSKVTLIMYFFTICILIHGINMSKINIQYMNNYISIYSNIISAIYTLGISILLFIILKYRIMKYLLNINFISRISKITEWSRLTFNINIRLSIIFAIFLNIIPIIGAGLINKTGVMLNDIIYLVFYVMAQILSFIILATLWDFLYLKKGTSNFVNALIFLTAIYLPESILKIFRIEIYSLKDFFCIRASASLEARVIIFFVLAIIFLALSKKIENSKNQNLKIDLLWR